MAQNWKKLFARINWNNRPSTATPLGASNLNKSDYALDEIDNRVIQLDTLKADMAVVNDMVSNVTVNTETGIITVTKKDGSTQTYDTKLEKIAINFDYDTENQRLVITLDDGTIKYVDMSALISEYDFTDTDSITFSVNGGNVSAIVKDGSITESKLHPNYLANIKGEVAKAEGASDSAAISSSEASDAANLSKSYAVGSTGTRADEDTDNAKFYSEKAKDIVDSFEGVTSVGLNVPTGLVASNSPITSSGNINVTFADNYSIPTNTKQDSWDAKYNKPSGGIPKSDLASAVQDNLDAINSKYSKPSTGIPKTDLASSVQTSLGKADTALQTEQYKGTYNKPSTGIPKSDLSQEVQAALDGGGKTYTFEGGTNQFTVNSSDGTTQDVEVLPNIQSITQAQYDALTDKTGTYFIKDSVDVVNASEVKYGNTNVASGIENAGLLPTIEIPANKNLNTLAYCNVGRYYCVMSSTVATLSNCPTSNAFVMEVYSPLSKDSSISPTGSVNRVRKILDYQGNEYTQYITIYNNTPTYNAWNKNLKSNDIDTSLSTSSTNAVQNKVVTSELNEIDRFKTGLIVGASAKTIPRNANLNTTEYLKVGTYVCSTTAVGSTISNRPNSEAGNTAAFRLEVYSLLEGVDDETKKSWVYRLRRFITYTGDEYIQYVASSETAGAFSYGHWKKIIYNVDDYTGEAQHCRSYRYKNSNNISSMSFKLPWTPSNHIDNFVLKSSYFLFVGRVTSTEVVLNQVYSNGYTVTGSISNGTVTFAFSKTVWGGATVVFE